MRIEITVAAMLLVSAGVCGSVRPITGSVVTIRLVNAATTEPVPDTAVSVYRESSIRCIRAPCTSDAASWEGRTDAAGRIAVPADVIRSMRNVAAAGLRGDLIEDSFEPQPGTRLVALLPGPQSARSLDYRKLIDARSGNAILNVTVRIEYRALDRRPLRPKPLIREARSNALGYVPLPLDVPDEAKDDVRVSAAGFRTVRVNLYDGGRPICLKFRAAAR